MRFLALLVPFALYSQMSDSPKLITSDIGNFWKAYDSGKDGGLTQTLQTLYLDPGSPGLKDFVKLRIESAAKLAFTIKHREKFYQTVRQNTLKVEEQTPAIRKYLARFRELYPAARFPDVYFVIGRVSTGGTTSGRGLLIGTEVYSIGPGVDTSEIEPSFRAAMGPPERLPLIVIHELTHTQQKIVMQPGIPALLANCLTEGAADFMTELVASSTINAYQKDFGDTHREELWQRFARDLAATPKDSSKWLYNYGSVKDEPADLGYWIGAEICRSYYERAANKAEAIRNIVNQAEPKAIVLGSRYAYLLDAH